MNLNNRLMRKGEGYAGTLKTPINLWLRLVTFPSLGLTFSTKGRGGGGLLPPPPPLFMSKKRKPKSQLKLVFYENLHMGESLLGLLSFFPYRCCTGVGGGGFGKGAFKINILYFK